MLLIWHSIINFLVSNSDILLSSGLEGDVKYIGAGLAAISFIGSGVGQGLAAAKAIEAIGRNPESEAKVRTFFIIGSAITESGAIYGLVVSMILMFVIS